MTHPTLTAALVATVGHDDWCDYDTKSPDGCTPESGCSVWSRVAAIISTVENTPTGQPTDPDAEASQLAGYAQLAADPDRPAGRRDPRQVATPAFEYIVNLDAEEPIGTLCPVCLSINSIAVEDTAVRVSNLYFPLYETEDGRVVTSASRGEGDFHTSGYLCLAADCGTRLDAPDNFDVQEWL